MDGLEAAPELAGRTVRSRLLSRLAPVGMLNGLSDEAASGGSTRSESRDNDADDGADGGARGCAGLRGLRVLDLMGSSLPAEALAQVPLAAPRLLALLLREACAVTDSTVEALLHACPTLQLLDLSCCQTVQGSFLLRGGGACAIVWRPVFTCEED